MRRNKNRGLTGKTFYDFFWKEHCSFMDHEEKYNTARWDAEQVRREGRSSHSRTPSNAANAERRRRNRRKGQMRRLLLWSVFVVTVSAILAGVGWLLANDMCSFNKEPVTATIEVTKDDNLSTIATKLKEEGLIEYKWFFKLFGRVRHAESKIGIGTYTLDTDMDYNALIDGMRNKNAALNADTVRVSIPEGYSVRQIVSLLAKYGVNTEEALLDAVENGSYDYDFLKSDRTGIARLEGYLFPDTYEFFVNEDAQHAISRLLDNFAAKMNEDIMDEVTASGYTLDQIITIASLIEKETDGSDRAKIASVIYNRLNNVGETYHKLEIDAAVIYGLGYASGEVYAGPLTQSDLEKDTPYNLRMHEGLPPTAICNPGLASIQAALEPADTNYYFYALGKDKVHHFFRTYAEHLNFVTSSQYGG